MNRFLGGGGEGLVSFSRINISVYITYGKKSDLSGSIEHITKSVGFGLVWFGLDLPFFAIFSHSQPFYSGTSKQYFW